MKTKLLIYLIPIGCLTAFCLWWFSDNQILKRRTNTALDCLELPVGTGRAERVLKADKARDLIAEHLVVVYPPGNSVFTGAPVSFSEPVTLARDKAVAGHSYMTEMMEFMHVESRNIKSIEIDGTNATVELSFTLRAKSKRGNEQSKQLDGSLTFKKIKSKWLLAGATFPN
ncbi:hypothetical protein Rhal01_01253 [Rubritalea halochordaticola]|uniref:SnoaL-like domain-containing protein n=1 Tax=Rubritalea halochordaticola TaxID=714537 RepID=A0ABP9V1W6_9BACT